MQKQLHQFQMVCAGLSSLLQEYKYENEKLRELLIAERELRKSSEAHIKRLQRDISTAKSEATKVESNMADALAAKDSEIEALVSSVDALKKQANMESIMRIGEPTETRMMQEHMELEKLYCEPTDLSYYKQTQLETMAIGKAAAEFQLEEVETERITVSRRAPLSWEEDTDMKALEPIPLYRCHMVGASMQLQKAAKLLGSGAVKAARFLWRFPTAPLLLLFYLVFVHLFLMDLRDHLQRSATSPSGAS